MIFSGVRSAYPVKCSLKCVRESSLRIQKRSQSRPMTICVMGRLQRPRSSMCTEELVADPLQGSPSHHNTARHTSCVSLPPPPPAPTHTPNRARDQISDHLTWAGANAARSLGIEHACHVTWPLHMLEEAGVLPSRSLSSAIGANVRALRSSWLAPAFMKPPGPPQAMLDGVRRQCFGVGTQGGLVLVTSSFGLEPARSLPPLVKLIGRGHQPETADTLTGHPELKASAFVTCRAFCFCRVTRCGSRGHSGSLECFVSVFLEIGTVAGCVALFQAAIS